MLGPKKAVRGDSTVIHFISVFSFKLLSLHHLSVIYNFLPSLDVDVKNPFVICNLSDNKSSKLVARKLSILLFPELSSSNPLTIPFNLMRASNSQDVIDKENNRKTVLSR